MIYPTLAAALAAMPDKESRVYCVTQATGNEYVVAVSPSAAALAVIGEDKVKLVSLRERYDAALAKMMEKAK